MCCHIPHLVVKIGCRHAVNGKGIIKVIDPVVVEDAEGIFFSCGQEMLQPDQSRSDAGLEENRCDLLFDIIHLFYHEAHEGHEEALSLWSSCVSWCSFYVSDWFSHISRIRNTQRLSP